MIRRVRVLSLAAFVAFAVAACSGDALGPADLDVTGHWGMNLGEAPSEFEFDLEEQADGNVSGTWSYPQQFAYHSVRGRRDGEALSLTADSHNSHLVKLDVKFVRRNVMEGTFKFGVTLYDVTLFRR